MARLQLNKTALNSETARHRIYRQYLPPLDLKRRELQRRLGLAEEEWATLSARIEALEARVLDQLTMLADEGVDLQGLVGVEAVQLGEENVMGEVLPKLDEVRIAVRVYSPLVRPHWVDEAVACLRERLQLQIQLQVAGRRLAVLARALKTVTQRVNLFDKVLIPRAEANIRRIRIRLADAERAEVIRAKIAKNKGLRS